MTPAARIAAAIGILDRALAGEPAEKLLTTWGRRNRYAGSGDRAAIRDLVFSALRCRRSWGWLGGSDSGRGLMIGAVRASGVGPNTLFTGEKFAPSPLREDEAQAAELSDAPRAVRLDCPDWLLPLFEDSLGPDTDAVMAKLRDRAPVFLRVNLRKTSREAAIAVLAQDGVEARPHPLSPTALEVTANARRIAGSAAYLQGLVELQDAASQAVVDRLPLADGQKVLDYCAGGGGKSLAMAARAEIRLTAHDANPGRLRDLPKRADRAGLTIEIADEKSLADASCDLVLCDVPCSGSGAWRRSPQGKWTLTDATLRQLVATQQDILDRAARLVRRGGHLAYSTCSLLTLENADQAAAFLERTPGWIPAGQHRFLPLQGGDGFFIAIFKRV